MELLYPDDLTLCGESLEVEKYGRWKNAVEGKGLRVNVNKTKDIQLLFGKKGSVSKVDPCCVCGEQVGCNFFSVRNVRGGFIVVLLMCLCWLSLLSCWDVFFCRTCLGDNCLVGEKLEFKKSENVLEEMEKVCYLDDMISCYGGASVAVSARIDSA